jgi:hypothetical protein
MGAAKRLMEQEQDDERMAQEFLIGAGLMEECEAHEICYTTMLFDPDEAEMEVTVNEAIADGKLTVPEGMSREKLIKLMVNTLAESGDECYVCRDIFDKD